MSRRVARLDSTQIASLQHSIEEELGSTKKLTSSPKITKSPAPQAPQSPKSPQPRKFVPGQPNRARGRGSRGRGYRTRNSPKSTNRAYRLSMPATVGPIKEESILQPKDSSSARYHAQRTNTCPGNNTEFMNKLNEHVGQIALDPKPPIFAEPPPEETKETITSPKTSKTNRLYQELHQRAVQRSFPHIHALGVIHIGGRLIAILFFIFYIFLISYIFLYYKDEIL